ncbi:hypothetical protein MPER_14506, partial [Moniliophthora perniciosa FA553]
SVCVMIARATAPNAIGPGSVFPDAAKWDFSDGLKGYLWFYRKEQLGEEYAMNRLIQQFALSESFLVIQLSFVVL